MLILYCVSAFICKFIIEVHEFFFTSCFFNNRIVLTSFRVYYESILFHIEARHTHPSFNTQPQMKCIDSLRVIQTILISIPFLINFFNFFEKSMLRETLSVSRVPIYSFERNKFQFKKYGIENQYLNNNKTRYSFKMIIP